jgi:GT2 family glycosyltransferase
MDLSFVILTWNSERYVEDCLRSIFTSLEGADQDYEIFVVDNGSSDHTPQILRNLTEQFPKIVKPIFLAENKGTTVSRNLALREACGKYLCVMDSDVILSESLFDPLLKVLNHDPKIGMVVPKILYPSGRWQKSTDQFPTFAHKINRLFRLRKIENYEESIQEAFPEVEPVDYAISAFWLIKREVFEKVGFFDEKIFYSPEDVDYCLRMWKCGYELFYVKSVHIVHHTQEISRGFNLNRAKISHAKGLFYLFCKHGYFLNKPVFESKSSIEVQ